MKSPACIVKDYLALEMVPEGWSIYVGHAGYGNNCMCVMDTQGIKQNRLMSGFEVLAYGVQILFFALSEVQCFVASICDVLSLVKGYDGDSYVINNISLLSGPAYIGLDENRRFSYSANFLLSIREK